jgi:hypothetical protein
MMLRYQFMKMKSGMKILTGNICKQAQLGTHFSPSVLFL